MSIQIRPFELSDGPAVGALCEWAWWPRRSQAGWDWLIRGADGAAGTGPAGWVVEDDGEIVASVGNRTLALVHGRDQLTAATGHSLLVRPDARGSSRALLKRFVGQNLFAVHTFNANALSSGHYRHYGMQPWPDGQAQVKYVWRVDPLALVTERALWRLGQWTRFEGLRDCGDHFINCRLWRPDPLSLKPGVSRIAPAQIDARFDRLWDDLVAEGRLLARRDRTALAWRCSDPDLTCTPVLLGFEAEGRLAGYLLAFMSKQTEIDRPTLEIIDVIALAPVETLAIPALVESLVRSAQALGAARVRMSLVNARLEPLIARVNGARRIVAHVHAHVRFADAAARERAADWYATPYDGDYSWCLRPPPRALSFAQIAATGVSDRTAWALR